MTVEDEATSARFARFTPASRRLRGTLDSPRRIKAFEPSTAHRAGMCRLLCMGLFARFLL
jgi:hypothetical protein